MLQGRAFKYGDNIDTDVIIPARYCTAYHPEELGPHCLEDLDVTFIQRVRPGDMIVAGRNFGCGSSRENAPLAILGAGVSAVIAVSFARIFYRNSINVGLPIFVCPEAVCGIEDGDALSVDIAGGQISNLSRGMVFYASPFPESIREIIKLGGLEAYVKQRLIENRKLRTD
jgi:3-isopropylmalate/(R)-2-methylmalate dehydratase small subunit